MIILATGQSNMAGRGTGGPSPLTANPLVQVWNNANELGSDGNAFITPPALGNAPWHSSGANNLSLWFAHAAANELNEPVYLVLIAKGSQSISHWSPTGDMYEAIKRIYALTGLPPADVLLWHQGESDKTMPDSCPYKVAFLNMLSRLRADGIISYTAPALVGEIRKDDAAHINLALNNLGSSHPDINFVHSDGLPDYDGTHYTGQALYEFGLRYWDKF